VDQAAHGRVWIGTDALEHGLVDKLGTLADAVGSAAELAGLEEGGYAVEYVEPQLAFLERFILSLTAEALPAVDKAVGAPQWPVDVARWLESAMEPLAFVARFNDPRHLYAYCFCDVR
jgi:protease-4